MASLGSFFDASDCSSSSEDESEPTTPVTPPPAEHQEEEEKPAKLPSPTSILLNIQRPEFLKSADQQARRDYIAEKRDQLEKDKETMTGAFAPKVPVGEIPTKALHPSAVVASQPVLYTESHSGHSLVDSGDSNSTRSPVPVKRAAADDGDDAESSGAKKSKLADT